MKRIIKVISYISFLIIICILFSACSKKYTVSFDTDDGKSITTIELEEGELVTAPEDPIRIGYVFNGWFLGEEKYDFDSEVIEDITLVAKWTAIKPTAISIAASSRQVIVEGTITLTVRPEPANACSDVIWSVDKEDKAWIDENGVLTGLSVGRIIVTATSVADENVFAQITITVSKNPTAE